MTQHPPALPPQRRAGADDQVLPPRGTATARRADQPRPGAVRRVTPAAAAADPRPGRGGRAVHRPSATCSLPADRREPACTTRSARRSMPRPAGTGTPPVTRPGRPAPQAGELIRGRGWRVKPDTPARELLTGVLAAPVRPGPGPTCSPLADACAGPAGQIAAADLAAIDGRRSLDSQLEGVIFGAVLSPSCSRRCGACPGRTRPRHSGSGATATGNRRPAEASQKAGAGQPLAGSNLASHPRPPEPVIPIVSDPWCAT